MKKTLRDVNTARCLCRRGPSSTYVPNLKRTALFVQKLLGGSDLSRPPRGVITPSFHATPLNHQKFKGGYQGVFMGGVYVIVMERDNKRGQILT